jgi:hypothetical protein
VHRSCRAAARCSTATALLLGLDAETGVFMLLFLDLSWED